MLPQFTSLFELLRAFPDEAACIAYLECVRWDGKPVSPFDPASIVYACKGGRYKCKNTNRYFNVKVGTLFEDTKIPLVKWFTAHFIFSTHKKGISSHQLSRDLGVTQKTAWFMLHRLRNAYDHPAYKALLSNLVEIDETYVGGKEGNKHARRRTPNTQGRSTATKTPVLGMLERDGKVRAEVVKDAKAHTILPIVNAAVAKGTTVYTDEFRPYNALRRDYQHQKVNHGAKQYVNAMAHTNSIEGFWSHLKRGVDGIYHWVSKKHLQAYVNEYTLRWNTRKDKTHERFAFVMGNMERRLTYKQLTGKV